VDRFSVNSRIVTAFVAIIAVMGGMQLLSALKLNGLDEHVGGVVEKAEVVGWVDDHAQNISAQAGALRTFAFSGLDSDKEAVEQSHRAASKSYEKVAAILSIAGEDQTVKDLALAGQTFEQVFDSIGNRLENSHDAFQVIVVGLANLGKTSALLGRFLADKERLVSKEKTIQIPQIVGRISQYSVDYLANGRHSVFEQAIKASEELDMLVRDISSKLKSLPRKERKIASYVSRDGDVIRQSLRQKQATDLGLSLALDQLEIAASGIRKITAAVKQSARQSQQIELGNMVSAVTNAVNSSVFSLLLGSLGAALLALLISRSILLPLSRITSAISLVAAGDHLAEIPDQQRRDELGSLAKAATVFKKHALDLEKLAVVRAKEAAHTVEVKRKLETERAILVERSRAEELESRQARAEIRRLQRIKLANVFEARVLHVVKAVNKASAQLALASRGLVANMAQTKMQVEFSVDATTETSSNVQAVAAATEELAASFRAVSEQMETSADIANQAVNETASTTRTVTKLSDAAAQIGLVTNLIKDIAKQTNMLALNATIEAQRAGDAGQGFSVVALEVKNLAAQSTAAAEEIAAHISKIQVASDEAGIAMENINATINKMDSVSRSVVGAVERQTLATHEISTSVTYVADSTQQVIDSVVIVSSAADESKSMSAELQNNAQALTGEAVSLDREVRSFLMRIRSDDNSEDFDEAPKTTPPLSLVG